MNNYFCDIGSKLSINIKIPNNINLRLPDRNVHSLFFDNTNAAEISQLIKKMKNKAGGVDNINAITLKKLTKYIVKPLAYVFNLCFSKSIWPDDLKRADIIPLHKGGDKTQMTNYRPISLISNLAKIMEKIGHVRLYNFLIINKCISNKQYGFLKNIGTTDALNHISNIIYTKLDKSKPIIAAFLDLTKAFDTVQHKLLLAKLERYGVRGPILKLLTNYLSNRKQLVKINGNRSTDRVVQIGVPQGTILGPLLFLIYVNDLLQDF